MAMTARLELGASVVGFVPGGDIAKAAVKGATKATKVAAKAGAKAADNVGKVVKGSTAAAADGLSGAQKGAGKVNAPRGPPSPNGRRGGPEHQRVVKERIEELQARGHTHTHGGSEPEEFIKAQNGARRHRSPDITMTAPDGSTYRANVGRATKSGKPVARERRALDDIERSKGARPDFIPYNKK